MAWEYHSNCSYYYQKLRIGDRVISRYLGNGPAAHAAARAQEAKRRRRERWKARIEQLRALDSALDDLCRQSDIVAAAALQAAGFHRQNYGPWRKKRREKQ
jgi:hypothetical protein